MKVDLGSLAIAILASSLLYGPVRNVMESLETGSIDKRPFLSYLCQMDRNLVDEPNQVIYNESVARRNRGLKW